MKTGPLIHGALLVAALLVAYQTWTQEEKDDPTTGNIVVWDQDPDAFESIFFDAENKSVSLTKKSDTEGSYLWGSVKRTSKIPSAPPATPPVAGEAAPSEDPIAKTKVTTRDFPVGEDGDKLVELVSEMRALRELGELSDELQEEYGLKDSKENLTVTFAGGTSYTLVIGKRVYGGSHRYASDMASSKSYVLSSDIMRPIDSGESTLALKDLHAYEADDITKAVVETVKGTKTALKKESDDPEKGKQTTWSWSETPDTADLTIANFLDRAGSLRPTQYDPDLDVATLIKIGEIRFQSDTTDLGFLTLYRQLPEAQKDEEGDSKSTTKRTQYWLATEETRALGKARPSSAERVDQDLVELFGIEPPPAPPKSEAPKAPAQGAPPSAPQKMGAGAARPASSAAPKSAPKRKPPAAPAPETSAPKAPKQAPPTPKVPGGEAAKEASVP